MGTPGDDSWYEGALVAAERGYEQDPRSRGLAGARTRLRWLEQLAPDAPKETALAVFLAHYGRWEVPRQQYESGRRGYLAWRRGLYALQAQLSRAIALDNGATGVQADRVAALVSKALLGSDDQAQVVEDCLILEFVDNELAAFSGGRDRAEVARIVKKTMKKASPACRELASDLVGVKAPWLMEALLGAD